MNFNRQTLTKLHELTQKMEEAKELASEALRTAQDRFKDVKHKIQREGKEIEITEKVMWDEVFYIGPECQSGKFLRKIHPEVFEAYGRQEECADAMKKFCILELEVDYTAMTLSNYLKMTEQLFEMMLAEREVSGNVVRPPEEWNKTVTQ